MAIEAFKEVSPADFQVLKDRFQAWTCKSDHLGIQTVADEFNKIPGIVPVYHYHTEHIASLDENASDYFIVNFGLAFSDKMAGEKYFRIRSDLAWYVNPRSKMNGGIIVGDLEEMNLMALPNIPGLSTETLPVYFMRIHGSIGKKQTDRIRDILCHLLSIIQVETSDAT